MNTAKIKAYAQQARRDFIQAVTEKAHMLGLSKEKIEPAEAKGDYAIIDGRPFPKTIEKPRQRLIKRIQQDGFELVMRSVAYTWFNRFVALRYMELHDYLDHGYRALGNRNGSEVPEILEHAGDLDFPGLNKDNVVELRLAGDKDNELYRLLIFAQCDALHRSMPFLFEKINHETELLLPDNLLHSNSPIRKLVQDIDEADWENVEIIGWIYQFYISEKKDEVIGKVVKSEDIPAATQLFTPNWIVKYMVQNTLGRQWLSTYPDSSLRNQMEFYIEPVEQTDEVQKQIAEITPYSIDPENLTLLDPACGSGHILVEAYDLFKAIYQERGYRKRDIPTLILEKNLYGLEICDRAAQLTGFALMMKARADDSRILNGNPPELNLMAIQSSAYIDAESLAKILLKEKVIRFKDDDKLFPDFEKQRVLTVTRKPEVSREDIIGLLDIFKQGKTFGSLITVPENVAEKMDALKRLVDEKSNKGDLFEREAAEKLESFYNQAALLSKKYDCVVTNPPYMGGRNGMNSILKSFAKNFYPNSKADLFSMFIERGFLFLEDNAFIAMITMQSWMFLSTFEAFRKKILSECLIITMAHLGARAFSTISGEVVQTTVFVCLKKYIKGFRPDFTRLITGNEEWKRKALIERKNHFRHILQDDFGGIPGSPIAYWVSKKTGSIFEKKVKLREIASCKQGIATSDNNRFLRYWFEVSNDNICYDCKSQDESGNRSEKWYPYNKGGSFRKWFGNNELIINWKNNGREIKDFTSTLNQGTHVRIKSREYYFKKNITYSALSSGPFACRFNDIGFLFDTKGSCIFVSYEQIYPLMGFLNSCVAKSFLGILCPTLDYSLVGLNNLPYSTIISSEQNVTKLVGKAVSISKRDWDSFETSWDFQSFPFLNDDLKTSCIETSFNDWQLHCSTQIEHMRELEIENNRIFIKVYGLQDELAPEVPLEEITLARAERGTDLKRLISYVLGCMMGRYSLDEPGLIYAHSGNEGFDPSRYKTYPADDDGVIPTMDLDWFPDDAANRFTEFLKITWSPETLEENLKFVADSLKPKRGEMPNGTIRRYLCTNFFKDHLKTYKKWPIYWLFSSGKLKAFECLVYLHRYNESTLSRMRSSYVTPLQGKFNALIDYLRNEIEASSTAATQKKLQKELDLLKKKQMELSAFDDELRHYADKRITLDLDDGVKVNYGKFGNLLAEKKAVTGKK